MGMGDSVTTICPVSNGTPHLLGDGESISLTFTWVVNNSPAVTQLETMVFNTEKVRTNQVFFIYSVLWQRNDSQQSLLLVLIRQQRV